MVGSLARNWNVMTTSQVHEERRAALHCRESITQSGRDSNAVTGDNAAQKRQLRAAVSWVRAIQLRLDANFKKTVHASKRREVTNTYHPRAFNPGVENSCS
jgi:hypothetical protein